MPTPFLVEGGPNYVGDGPTDETGQNSDCGPWFAPNGDRIIAILERRLSDFVGFAAFKNTSTGTSFNAPLDFANAPVADVFTCYQRPGETTISFMTFSEIGFAAFDFGGIGVFDLASGTYTSFHAFTNVPDTGVFPVALVKFSDGTYGIFYRDVLPVGGGNFDVKLLYITCSATGVLGTPQLITDGPFNSPASVLSTGIFTPQFEPYVPGTYVQPVTVKITLSSCAVTSNDKLYFTFARGIYAPPQVQQTFDVFWNSVISGSVGTASLIVAGIRTGGAAFVAETSSNLRGFYHSGQDKAFLPDFLVINNADITITNGSWPMDFGIVVIVAASTGSPSMTIEPISNGDEGAPGFWQYPCFWNANADGFGVCLPFQDMTGNTASGGTLYYMEGSTNLPCSLSGEVFYLGITQLASPNSFLFVWCRSAGGSSWTGPTTWWSYLLNPPAGNPNDGGGQYTPLSIHGKFVPPLVTPQAIMLSMGESMTDVSFPHMS